MLAYMCLNLDSGLLTNPDIANLSHRTSCHTCDNINLGIYKTRHYCYTPIRFSFFLLDFSREIVMGSEGGFYGFGLWKIKFLNIPLIFAGFVLLGKCLPATYCTIFYGFKRMKEEEGYDC